jgi:AcrR family transcriptional regulator
MPETITPIALGLRERKKLKTKESIQREALRLFQEQGYDETTIEQIAAAAEISPSTFFNYFPTKEDVVLYDRYDPVMVSLIEGARPDEPLSQTIKRALEGLGGVIEPDRQMVLARAKLGLEAPSLRARFWEELQKAQALLGGLISVRTGRDAADFEVRVLSMMLVTASFEATQEWLRRGGAGVLFDIVKEALEVSGVFDRLDALGTVASKPA